MGQFYRGGNRMAPIDPEGQRLKMLKDAERKSAPKVKQLIVFRDGKWTFA